MPSVRVVSCLIATVAFAAGCGSGTKAGTSGTSTGSSTMCSTHCGAHAFCDLDGGTPTCACRAGYESCPSDGGIICTDLQTDSANCKTCGTACTAPESCSGGTCTCAPSAFIANCPGGECADLRSDPNHCGGCKGPTVVCGAGQVCAAGDAGGLGSCECPDPSLTGCPNGCFDLTSDPNNCGCCGTACLPGEGAGTLTCTAGACGCPGTTIQCPTATDACGLCVDTQWDPNNCNGCGNVCFANGTSVTCDAGNCFCGDTGNGIICPDFSCPDVNTDVNNCGGCGNACVLPTPFCVNGQCADAGP